MKRFLVLIFLLALAACGRGGEEKKAQAPPPEIVLGPADTAVVVQGDIRTGPALTGTLMAKQEATVRAQISGSILEAFVEPGEAVRRGQILARLDASALRDAYTSAQVAVENARSNVALAEREAERQRILAGAGAVAERNVETATQSVAQARSQLAAARAQLSAAEKQLGYTRIEAPITGVVSERPVSSGDVVQPGTAVYTVVDPSLLELEASVPAERLSAVSAGAPVEFTVNGFPGRTFQGRISRINPAADPATRQVRVYAEIPNPGNELVSGLFAEGRVASRSAEGLLVPEAAIDRRMGPPAVIRVQNGTVRRVPVRLGIEDPQEQKVQIVQGVAEGDVVLVGAAQEITPGTAVRLAPAVRQEAQTLAQNYDDL
jgi:membrane fusion protein, multidrug efflux system